MEFPLKKLMLKHDGEKYQALSLFGSQIVRKEIFDQKPKISPEKNSDVNR